MTATNINLSFIFHDKNLITKILEKLNSDNDNILEMVI
jgi:hypothetical protein